MENLYNRSHRPAASNLIIYSQRKRENEFVQPETQSCFQYSDLGNAERFVAQHGENVRYLTDKRVWMVYRDGRWVHDTGAIYRYAKITVRSIKNDVLNDGDSEEYQRAVKYSLKCESQGRIAAMLNLARNETSITTSTGEFDRDRWTLNALNGTIDLRTSRLRSHNPDDLISKHVPIIFDPSAECPTWVRFIHRIMGDDVESVRLLQQIAGISLTGDVSVQKLFIFVGRGQNGKSTFLNTLLAMLGDYAIQAEPNLLFTKSAHSHPTGQADLAGVRLAVCSEGNAGHGFDEAMLKRLTGGEHIRARHIARDFFEFDPTHTPILATNHRPVVHGTDEGIWRRLVIIPFDQYITDVERDDRLAEKLKAELPGILAWAVRGCLDWQEHGLVIPSLVEQVTNNYRKEMDTIGIFIEEMCVTGADVKVGASEVFGAYKRWTSERSEKPVSMRRFGESLTERGFEGRRSGKGGQVERHGIALQ